MKKILKLMSVFLIICALSLAAFACSNDPVKYTVTFDTQGGSAIASQSVETGKTATKPSNPNKSGYDFVGWSKKTDTYEEFKFDTAITADITIYANWKAATTAPAVTVYPGTFVWSLENLDLMGPLVAMGTISIEFNESVCTISATTEEGTESIDGIYVLNEDRIIITFIVPIYENVYDEETDEFVSTLVGTGEAVILGAYNFEEDKITLELDLFENLFSNSELFEKLGLFEDLGMSLDEIIAQIESLGVELEELELKLVLEFDLSEDNDGAYILSKAYIPNNIISLTLVLKSDNAFEIKASILGSELDLNVIGSQLGLPIDMTLIINSLRYTYADSIVSINIMEGVSLNFTVVSNNLSFDVAGFVTDIIGSIDDESDITPIYSIIFNFIGEQMVFVKQ